MKFIGAISSIVSGIMAIVGLSLTCLEYPLGLTYSGWELIKSEAEATGAVLFKLFAIIGLIVGIVLILYGIFLLLIDLKVLKVKSKINLYMINNILLSIFVFCMILAFVGAWVMKGDALVPDKTHIGVGTWLMLVIPAVLCLLSWILARKPSKK